MKLDELTSLFGAQLKVFEPIVGQPTNADITCLQEVLTALLYPIPYNGDKQIHSLLGIIMSDVAYTAQYKATFSILSRVSHYTTTIADKTEHGKRAKAESKHTVKKLTMTCMCPPAMKQASLFLPS